MNKISCIAIDDEPLALGLIVSYIEKTPFLELKGEFDNPLDAMEFLEDNPIHLLFLDIQMPDLTGIDFAKCLEKRHRVIFTTAYEKFALQGFQVEAMDYLLKPISYKVFLKSANRAKNYFELINHIDESPEQTVKTEKDYLFVKSDLQIKKVNYSDILFFEGLKDYIKLFTKSSKKAIVFHATMKAVEAKLPLDKFMRVHRSYIVNLENIKTIEKYRIIFGKNYIPVSDKYKSNFDDFIKNKFL
jgi:DNA-binding LytR/AlgR family response regulator